MEKCPDECENKDVECENCFKYSHFKRRSKKLDPYPMTSSGTRKNKTSKGSTPNKDKSAWIEDFPENTVKAWLNNSSGNKKTKRLKHPRIKTPKSKTEAAPAKAPHSKEINPSKTEAAPAKAPQHTKGKTEAAPAKAPQNGALKNKKAPLWGINGDHLNPALTKAERETLTLLSKEFLTPKQCSIRRKCDISQTYRIIRKLKQKGLMNRVYNETVRGGPKAPQSQIIKTKGRGLKAPQTEIKQALKAYGTMGPTNHTEAEAAAAKAPQRGAIFLDQEGAEHSGPRMARFLNHLPIRLHGQQFDIKLLGADRSYYKNLKATIHAGGNTIRCFKDKIDVYSNTSFIGPDTREATNRSLDYWKLFFIRLENTLKINIIKEGANNIQQVKAHYAQLGNELATAADENNYKIEVKGADGKIWLLCDYSHDVPEMETVHSTESETDMGDIIEPFFNDLKDKRPAKISEIQSTLKDITTILKQGIELNKETAAGLNAVVTYLKTLLPKEQTKAPDLPADPSPNNTGDMIYA